MRPKKKKKKAPQGGLDSCSLCIRYILVAANCMFFLFGCAVIGLGIYVVVDKVNFVSGLFGIPLVAPASYLIIAAGCIVFLISFIGCFGALFESKPLLILYSIVLIFVFLISVTGLVLAIIFRTRVNDRIREYMRKTIQLEYGVNLENEWNRMVTTSWDQAQRKWYCCSVDDESWGVYRQSEWFAIQAGVVEADKPFIPATCCVRDQYGAYVSQEKCQLWNLGPPGKQSGLLNEAVFYDGCFKRGKKVLFEISGYLIGIGVFLAVVVVGGIVFAVMLARRV